MTIAGAGKKLPITASVTLSNLIIFMGKTKCFKKGGLESTKSRELVP